MLIGFLRWRVESNERFTWELSIVSCMVGNLGGLWDFFGVSRRRIYFEVSVQKSSSSGQLEIFNTNFLFSIVSSRIFNSMFRLKTPLLQGNSKFFNDYLAPKKGITKHANL
jgi:hypothetical protein